MSASNGTVISSWVDGKSRVGTNLNTDGNTLFMYGEPVGRTLKNGTKSVVRPTDSFLGAFNARTANSMRTVLTATAGLKTVSRSETPSQFQRAFRR